MLIDVNNLTVGQDLDFALSERFDVESALVDAKIDGQISRLKDRYLVRGQINAVLSLNCDLCLDTFKVELNLSFDESFSDDENSDEEFWDFSDKTIDLKPAVIANILLNMPMRAVCSDDCKGLCPKCGHNLNKGDCGCDTGYVNPQFEKLLTLFNDDKEV